MSKTTNKFSPEVRERAVRLVFDNEGRHESRWSAILSILAKIGYAPQTLNEWVKRAGEWAKLGGQTAIFETGSLPSSTAAHVTATRCAPCGDHLMRRRLPIRVFPMSSTQPSARDDEIANPFRYR